MLYRSDTYYTEYSYPLDNVQSDVLILLYQPLIGQNAYGLYMTLLAEAKRMDRFHRACLLSRLLTIMHMSLEELEENLKKLEAIGLLKSYVKQQEGLSAYLYRLISPLTLPAFFRNQILVTLLKQTLGNEEFEKTKNYFRLAGENKREYEEITAKFSDVFTFNLDQSVPLELKSNFLNYKEASFETEYDLSLFEEVMKDYQISHRVISPHMTYIKQLAVLYNVDNLTLASLVRESIEDNKFVRKVFKEKCLSFYNMNSTDKMTAVYLKQAEKDKEVYGNDSLSLHLQYLEKISPYELLKHKQGGGEPSVHDLSIAETLMTQLGLNPGVVNLLIEYVLGKNNDILSRSYCETIGASWARKHIKTVKEAYEATLIHRKPSEIIVKKKKKVQEPADDQDLSDILNRLKGDRYD